MHPYLTRLGISPEIQAFFEPFWIPAPDGSLWFDHGDGVERYAPGCHLVPLSARGWFAGERDLNLVRRVFICSSAMEAIAFLHGNRGRFPRVDNLLFVSVGLSSGIDLSRFAGLPTGLIFDNDLSGKLRDLKMAYPHFNLIYRQPYIFIGRLSFHEEQVSLHRVQKILGLRGKTRTYKSPGGLNWIALLDDAGNN